MKVIFIIIHFIVLLCFFLFQSFFHSAFLQNGAAETNHPARLGVCCVYIIMKTSQMDFPEKQCHRINFSSFPFFRTVNILTPLSGFWKMTQKTWTWGSPSMKSALERFAPHEHFVEPLFPDMFSWWTLPLFFRPTNMNWSPVVLTLLSQMKTRRNILSKKQFTSYRNLWLLEVLNCLMLLCVSAFDSMVMQWRFVHRVQKQMAAFKEVIFITSMF